MDITRERALAVGLLWMRVLMGLGIAYHGFGKVFGVRDGAPAIEGFTKGVEAMGFPFPGLFAWAAALSEFLGGILIILGLGTRGAGFLLLVTMLVAAFVRHGTDPFRVRELALAYGTVAAALAFMGAGSLSLDALVLKKWRGSEGESEADE